MDKDALFKQRLTEQELELDGVGTVRLRALTRGEVSDARELFATGPDLADLDVTGYEDALVALSLVDPVLTPEEVRRWDEAAPAGELARVMEAIRDLSGLGEEAAKSRVRGNRRERRAAVRTGSRGTTR